MNGRRIIGGASILVGLLVLLQPAAVAQTPADLVAGFPQALTELAGGSAFAFDWQEVPASEDASDPDGDLYTLEGGTPTSTPAYADLVGASQFGFTMSPATSRSLFAKDGGPLDCARPEVACPSYDTSTEPFGEGAFVVGFQLAGVPEPSGTESFTVAILANDDDYPTAQDPRPASPFVGTNKAWRLDLNAQGDAVAYLQVADGAYQEFHTDARVLMEGDHGWFLIPPAEFPVQNTIIDWDAHSYYKPDPASAPGEDGADSIGDVNPRGRLIDVIGSRGILWRLELELDSPTESPVTESPAEGGAGGSEAGTADDGDSFSWWLIGLGLVILAIGGLFITGHSKTEETMPEEDIGVPGIGFTKVRGPEDIPAVAAPPTVARHKTPTPVEFAYCDWAVYYLTAAGPKVLRPAKGPECCKYTVSVVMKVDTRELAARGRQEGVTPGAPRSRLRIPALTLEPVGLGGRIDAAVRSGPAEDMGWMQGFGEPEEPEDVGPYTQLRSHEEPPDVAAHAAWEVAHIVKITLESMCPGHVNTFTGVASSQIAIDAGIECTNQGPPECPIEFTAGGWVHGAVSIFFDYDLKQQIGSDPDEMEPVAPQGTPFHAITDLHDHEQRDRMEYSANQVASTEGTREGDDFWLVFETGLVGDAGTIVPESVWPATGRVTAHTGSSVEHGATIDAEMQRVDCLAGACCGYTECRCEPALRLSFAGNKGVIEADGTSFRITPTPGGAGAARPWALG